MPRRRSSLEVVGVAWLAGSVPFAQIAAKLTRSVDLREVGSGTVSGTSLYRVAGFGPLAVAGVLEVAKGAAGPALAGRDRPYLAALAGGAAVVGHNWSPFLAGAGGRGLSPAIGAVGVQDPTGAVVILAGLAAGRLVRQTGFVTLLATLGLVPVLTRRRRRQGTVAALAVLVPIVAKRVLGNAAPVRWSVAVVTHRLLFDRDPGSAGT